MWGRVNPDYYIRVQDTIHKVFWKMPKKSNTPLEPKEYYEIMVFLIHEQYDTNSLDETGALDVALSCGVIRVRRISTCNLCEDAI